MKDYLIQPDPQNTAASATYVRQVTRAQHTTGLCFESQIGYQATAVDQTFKRLNLQRGVTFPFKPSRKLLFF